MEKRGQNGEPNVFAGLLQKFAPAIFVVVVVLAFAVGVLWQKVSNLESGKDKVDRIGSTTGTVQGTNPTEPTPPASGKLAVDQAKKIPQVSSSDHFKGSQDAKVFLVEYSDFECPYCARFHPTASKLLEEYDGQIAWVYRHFPLASIHPKARPAANASECIAEQGGNDAFWKFADMVFADPTKLSSLEVIASQIGVDANAFKSCLDQAKYDSKITAQYDGGMAAGVTGTPGNFVVTSKGDAWYLPGAYPYETLKATVEEALQTL